MAGEFDDLIPKGASGRFDDLVPKGRFDDLVPGAVPQLEDEEKGVVASAGRAAVAFGEGFSGSVEAGGGLGISQETAGQLGPLVNQTPEEADQVGMGTVRMFNRLIVDNFVAALEIGNATFEGAVSAIGQISSEFGGTRLDKTTNRIGAERFSRQVTDSTIIVGALNPGRVVTRGSAARVNQTTISRAADDLPDAKRAEFIDRATEEIEKSISNPMDPLDSARSKIGRDSLGVMDDAANYTIGQRAQIEIFDQLRPIKIAAEKAAKEAGVTPDLTPYNEMRLVAGARGVTAAVIKHGTVVRTKKGLEFNGDGLDKALQPIADSLEDGLTYFAGRRAAELKKQGRENLFSDPEIEAMLKLETPERKAAFQQYQAFDRRNLDFAEQSGLLSKESKAAMLEMGKDYVPFHRVAIDQKGRVRQPGSPFKRLKGGKENINDIAENIYRNTAMIIDASVKNAAKRDVYDMIDNFGLTEIAERIPLGTVGRATIIDKDLRKMVEDLGAKLPESAVQALTYNQKIGDDIDVVFRNGERQMYRIKDPILAKAMHAYGPRNYQMALNVLGFPKKVLTRAITLAPDFMAANLVRDTQAAFIQSEELFVPFVSSLRGMASRVRRDENYWSLMANGGGFSTLYKGEVGAGKDLRRLYTSRGVDYSTVLDIPRKIANAAEEISSAFEMASRLEEFRLVAKKGDLRAAALSSREVSTDFAMRGQSELVNVFTTSVPFMNARLQGLERFARKVQSDPAKVAVKGLTAITLPSLALYAYNKDDPRYQALPDWQKDNHWNIFVPGRDAPFLIPKGFEFGAVFATVPERIFEAIEQKHGKRFADAMLQIVMDQLSMNPTPQIAKPLVEQAANRNFFFNTPIVPTDLEGVKPSEQFRPWTSETMVVIARGLSKTTGVEVSPMRAEALVRGYFGTLGMYLLDASDSLVRAASDEGEAPDKRLDEYPVVRRFLRSDPVKRTQYETDFYDLLGATREVTATFSKVTREARNPDLSDDETERMALAPQLEKISEAAGAITQQMRMVNADPALSGAEKREQLDELIALRNELFTGIIGSLPEDLARREGIIRPNEQ